MDALAESITASQTSKVLKPEKYAAVIQHLKDPSAKVDAHLKHWVKQKKFQLMAVSESGKRPWPISRLPEILKMPMGNLEIAPNPENARNNDTYATVSGRRTKMVRIFSITCRQIGTILRKTLQIILRHRIKCLHS